MPRSLVNRLLEELKIPDDDSLYIVLYTLEGRKPPKEFYIHLARLSNKGLIEKFAPNSIICKGLKTAIVLREITKRYSIKVRIFKAVELDFLSESPLKLCGGEP